MYDLMNSQSRGDFDTARRDFQKLHRRAVVSGLLARIRKRPVTLRSFQSADSFSQQGVRQLQDVPLSDIRGSVGRAADYTASFLPRRPFSEERWVRVRVAVDSDLGVAPLELLELDGMYYVKDGHHRVSVFKYLKVRRVEAYVTKFKAIKLPQPTSFVQPFNPTTPGGCQVCITNV